MTSEPSTGEVGGPGGAPRFTVLGPLAVRDGSGDLVSPGGPKLGALLALLLCRANRPIPVAVLADALWGGSPPPSARANLQTYVCRLRQVIGDRDTVAHVGGGYVLNTQPEQIDAGQFGALTACAADHRRAGDLERARSAIAAALDLWRGEPYAGVPDSPAVHDERLRLEHLRLSAWQDRFELDLALGRHAAIVPELTGLLLQHPLREELRAQLMTALARCGRHAEALAVCREGRTLSIEELGHEPGTRLRRLEAAILTEDLDLSTPEPTGNAPAITTTRAPTQLPPDPQPFTGREKLSTQIHERIIDPAGGTAICAISGPAGAGKSALAMRAAHRAGPDFVDGLLYVDLRGFTPGLDPMPPLEALRGFHRSLGVQDAEVPLDLDDAIGSFRTLTAHRRLLVVLDNATDVQQVRPLLPGGSHNAVLITSRRPLTTLDGARTIHLGELTDDEAQTLLERLIGTDRAALDRNAVGEIAHLCGRLPLALRIAGARLANRPDLPLPTFAKRLRDSHTRLDHLEAGDLAVRASLDTTRRDLEPRPHGRGDIRLLEITSLLDTSDITVPLATALTALPAPDVAAGLERLTDAQLLRSSHPGRYHLHDLLRLYARERAQLNHSDSDRHQAVRRAIGDLLAATRAASNLLAPPSPWDRSGPPPDGSSHFRTAAEAAYWVDTENANLVAAAHQAADLPGDGPQLAAELALALRTPLDHRGLASPLLDVAHLTLRIVETSGNQVHAAHANFDAAAAYLAFGHNTQALQHCQRAANAFRQLDRALPLARALHELGNIHRRLDQLTEAEACYRQAMRTHPLLTAAALTNLARIHQAKGELAIAIITYRRSLPLRQRDGDLRGQAITRAGLADALRLDSQPHAAIDEARQAIGLYHDCGHRRLEPHAWWTLGHAHADLGQDRAAQDAWVTALQLLRAMNAITEDESGMLLSQVRPPVPAPIRNSL